ncbi:hypothetical protein OG782_19895 [Streptomyces sp. NBC_00876]|uniref:hypothetical protein n=1 Tax=Streptomyces sp. NBC_00876 TaxID=2975853 RepID=UPI0038708DDE|nr:hypothetical protein OG782_19895 [Streptomyces sp. NBC_00876]
MSAPEERGALTPRPSLYAYALRLIRAEPGGQRPERGYPLPGPPAPPGQERQYGRSWAESRAAVAEALNPLLAAPDPVRAAEVVHLRLAELAPAVRDVHIGGVVSELPLEHEARARALGRRLTRTGTSSDAVHVGLALLVRLGEPEDVPCLKALAQLRALVRPAVRALDAIDRPTAALTWLGRYIRTPELRRLVTSLEAGDGAAALRGLAALPQELRTVGPVVARRILEAARPLGILRDDGQPAAEPAELAAQVGWLLFCTTSLRDDRTETILYEDAVRTYEAFVSYAGALTPTLDHYALLLSTALDLTGGPGRLHDWGRGRRREALLDELEAVLDRPAWRAVLEPAAEPGAEAGAVERRRFLWARRTAGRPFSGIADIADSGEPGEEARRLRIEIVERDPADSGTVEVRVLIDGRPLVPEAFGRGPAHSPEWLLDSGRLRATVEPHEVQLAEAYCTEGCCGALYVTIRRDGDEVVWSDWRCPAPPPSPLHTRHIPEYRFDAAAYDAEIRRAENDQGWTWPARRTARLIAAGLRDRPELLTRWEVELSWAGTEFRDPDHTVVCLRYADEGGATQHRMWTIPEDGTAPEDGAAAALHRLATEDPRTYGT